MSGARFFCIICRSPLYQVKLAMDHGVCNWRCLDELIERGKKWTQQNGTNSKQQSKQNAR